MSGRSQLASAPPHQVEQAIAALGRNIRTARLRRNLTLAEVAAKLGTERHVVGNAERGKPSTSIAVYAGLLWTLGLVGQMSQLADPQSDTEGQLLARGRDRTNAYARKGMDDDF